MKINAFRKAYGSRTVLDFPGIELKKRKIYAVIGANGSGKSTFARILAGTISADKPERHLEEGTVGFLPQKPYAFRMSTEKNLLLNGIDKEKAREILGALGLEHLAQKRGDRLSGGETARMALGRLLMREYDLVVLDEPTAAMDMESTILAEKLMISYVRQTGCVLVLITHSLQQARRIADYALYFHKGVLAEQGIAGEMLYTPEKKETRGFLEFYGL